MNMLRWLQSRAAVNYGFGYPKISPLIEKVVGLGAFARLQHCGPRKDGCDDSSSTDDALQVKEAPALDPEWAMADCKKLEALERSSGTVPIYLTSPESVATTNGVPTSPTYDTLVCIRRSAKYATMSGTAHTNHWLAVRDFDKNWTEPLMDWTSSSDPYTSMAPLTFPDKASAINFCEKNRYSWYIQQQPKFTRNPIVRRYEDNFHWNRRSRISTR